MSKLTFIFGLLFSLISVNVSAHHAYGHGLERPQVYPGPSHAPSYPQQDRHAHRDERGCISHRYVFDQYGRRWLETRNACGTRQEHPRHRQRPHRYY
jgi:hypothetical protein